MPERERKGSNFGLIVAEDASARRSRRLERHRVAFSRDPWFREILGGAEGKLPQTNEINHLW